MSVNYLSVELFVTHKFEAHFIFETGEATPTKIGVHAFDIDPYLHEFFEPIPIDSIFSLPWTIVHGQKGKFGRF